MSIKTALYIEENKCIWRLFFGTDLILLLDRVIHLSINLTVFKMEYY